MSDTQVAADIGVLKQFTVHEEEYRALLAHMKVTLEKRIEADGASLFRTKTQMGNKVIVEDLLEQAGRSLDIDLPVRLNQVYLGSLTDERQYHTCSCCSSFLKHFGSLVTIDSAGETHSAVWDASTFPQENFYYPFVKNIQAVVERGNVTGAHRNSKLIWGDFVKGNFEHFALQAPLSLVYKEVKLTDRRKQAELLEDYVRMAKAFASPTFSIENLNRLIQLFNAETLPNDEIIKGVGYWLHSTATERAEATDSRIKKNLLWRAIATAPAGFAHAPSTTVNTVLEDLKVSLPINDIKAKYAALTRADRHRRPTTAPSDGAIDETEKLVDKLGLAPAFRRRVAYYSDIPNRAFVWEHKFDTPLSGGGTEKTSLFGHLKAKVGGVKDSLDLPATAMSWNKFTQDILPDVKSMELLVPATRDFFVGLATAAVADAPAIFSHDLPEERNPVTSYTRFENNPVTRQMIGLDPATWNLVQGTSYAVKGIIKVPVRWGSNPPPNTREQLVFVLEGAYDRHLEYNSQGLAIFPSLLKSEFHSMSRVVEAFSNAGHFEGEFSKQVAGVSIVRGAPFHPREIKVQTSSGTRKIRIDRWE